MSATRIEKAGYGVYNSTIDVTDQVAAAYERGERTFRASNQWGDPAPKERKYLYIFWGTGNGVTGEDDARGIIVP